MDCSLKQTSVSLAKCATHIYSVTGNNLSSSAATENCVRSAAFDALFI